MGISRSATAIIAWLMRTYKWDLGTALEDVKKKRKIRPNESFREQLEVWEAVGYNVWTDEKKPKPEFENWLQIRAED